MKLNAVLCREDHLEFNEDGDMVIKVRDGGVVCHQRDLPVGDPPE